MAKYTDFQLEKGKYNKAKEHTDTNALVLAIRNILLSRPGNFPFNPSIGLNIKKYQFDILDDNTLKSIKNEIDRSVAILVPDANLIDIQLRTIREYDNTYLGISIFASMNGNENTVNFLIVKENDDIKIFNEIY